MGVAVRMAVLDTLSRGTAAMNRQRRYLPLPLWEGGGGGVEAVDCLSRQPPGEGYAHCFTGVRLLDPAAGLDIVGDLLVRDGAHRRFRLRPRPAGWGRRGRRGRRGALPGPGRHAGRAGRAGFEYRETIASAAAAAAAGGITTLAALPDTLPAIDDPALVRALRARGEETGSLTILPYGAVTRGCRGEELAELGLLREAGAVAFTDGARAIGPARLMRLALSYARWFGGMIVQHPEDPSLAAGGAATEGELATRLGLPGIPAAAEAIRWRAT